MWLGRLQCRAMYFADLSRFHLYSVSASGDSTGHHTIPTSSRKRFIKHTCCNKCCGTMWHGVKETLNVCLWKRISSFEAEGRGIRARRRPTKCHTCSIGDISGEKVGRGRSCMCWAAQKSQTVFSTRGRALSC
ncbi:uncharacterized protein TNCV_1547481 [Trichonephila clavipes]|nr:uncharacterized protein TNCV_1547481 [Trichonephila clavipes]